MTINIDELVAEYGDNALTAAIDMYDRMNDEMIRIMRNTRSSRFARKTADEMRPKRDAWWDAMIALGYGAK